MLKRVLLFCALSSAIACGGSSPSAPTSSAPPAQVFAQAQGVWNGSVVLGTVTGGECFGPAFLALIGTTSQISLAITQSGSNVTAIWSPTTGGGNFSYSGTVGQTAINMNDTACSACNQIGLACPNGAGLRDIRLQSGNFVGATDGRVLTATDSKIYNVFVSGTQTPVGVLNFATTVSLTKQ